MFFELISNASKERFVGAKLFSITDLQHTSYANGKESLYLIKVEQNGKLFRHYVNDYQWFDASDVNNVNDISLKWQGFVLATLKNSDKYEEYSKSLEMFYIKKYSTKIRGRSIAESNKIDAALSSVLDYEEMFLSMQSGCGVEK